MELIQIPDYLKKILKLSLLLIFVSTFTIFFTGIAANNVNYDVKSLKIFIQETENIQPNFEKSLLIYTEKTQHAIDYLLKLRPISEKDLVLFISEVEAVGLNLNLDVDLESQTIETEEKILNYNVSFYGTNDDLIEFLYELEKLDYYIRINSIDFRDPRFLEVDEMRQFENIYLSISLFTK